MSGRFLISLRKSVMRLSSPSTLGRFRDDAGAALISVMLFIVLLGGLSLVLLATLLGQIAPSFSAQQNTQTGYAAQAGLQAGVGALRASGSAPNAEGIIYGNSTRLPCGFTGNVDSTAESIRYEVSIQYYSTDPTNQSDVWRDANDLTCLTPGGVSQVPRYALLVSGAVSPATANAVTGESQRIISAIYEFQITNINIPGGRIWDFNGEYCMRAVTATAGSQITYNSAANCPDDNQLALWVYDTDYRIKLASTTVAGQTPLCMTGPIASAAIPNRMQLQPCLEASTPARWNQLWNLFAGPVWYGQNQTISIGRSGICISSGFSNGTNLVNQFVLARSGCVGSQRPEAKVGAGAASKATNQIVSYSEFGRCADVTDENINRTFMIVYPCKQDARGGGAGILWNHKWFYEEPAVGAAEALNQDVFIRLNDSMTAADKYCMQTPIDTSATVYVAFAVCNNTVRQDWDRVQDSGNYDTSYLFIDKYGRCLTANPNPADLYASAYSKMTVASCNGTLAQKWNAPPGTTEATFGGYREYGG